MTLNEKIEGHLLANGAVKVGFATVETLAGGPPSADLTYRLEGARSAVSFALPLDRDRIRKFLGKEERLSHDEDNIATHSRSKALAWEVAGLLKAEGHEAKGVAANQKYRKDIPDAKIAMAPDISHRYIAVRSGVGSFGWSGNIGLKDHGCAILLGTCVTAAELEPTEPIPEDESFCDNCKMCVSACAVDMFERDKEMSVTLGGVTFTHAARKTCLLCRICCGGITGLHKSGKWSTWSPGRFDLPNDEKELRNKLESLRQLQAKRPSLPGEFSEGSNLQLTCGACQLICWGNKKDTAKNLKLLRNSGCPIQKPDGTVAILPSDEAEKEFAKFDPEHKALYR